jgi:hypothetical protein
LMHLWLRPQPNLRRPEDSSSKHDQVHLCSKMSRNCVQVQFKTSSNWCAILFEFVLASVEISRSFDGFIYICNWVFWNMDGNCFLGNWNMNWIFETWRFKTWISKTWTFESLISEMWTSET